LKKIIYYKNMQIRNETEIQLMKILYKTQKKKPTKNLTSKRAYPFGIENELYRKLKGFFKPLTDYVNKYLDENLESLLRGDSTEIRLDTMPGDSFRNIIYNLENWLSVYMPDISDLPEDSNNNVILTSLGKTADEAKKFGDKEFTRIIEKGIHVTPPISSPWWEDMKNSWAEDNYTLITSNAKKYVSQINTFTEQAIVNGLSPAKLKEQIKKATEGLSDKHCKLLARDQMGKLNGQITEAQMQEVGLDLYVWSTSYDDRVRDSHALMEGLLCRWDDASVCSYDNGKTWVARPSGAVDLHPGQDIQCRCVALSFYPELEAEMEGVSLNSITEDLPDVQDTINDDFIKNKIDKLEDLGHGDVKNIIPMGYKEFLTEASKIYNEQRKMGEQIYIEKMVDLSDIVTRQEWLDKDTLIDFIKYDKSKEKGDLIRAVYYKNKYMLIDGNHRVAMAILKGGKRIKIAVLNPIKK
jgi:SPP1 gp7 family putative phage head morphogenesis protein